VSGYKDKEIKIIDGGINMMMELIHLMVGKK
jgi:hypothetical protein